MKLLSLFFILSPIFGAALAQRNGRISGGATATRGQFPYHVHIEAFDGRTTSICGGAFIRYNYVLTTAICIMDSVDIIVRLGMTNRLGGPLSGVFRITTRDRIIIHPNFNDTTYSNDLALLYLDGAENLIPDPNGFVDVIDLPIEEDYQNELIGLHGYVTGFGLMNDEQPLLSMSLQYVELPVISRQNCQTYFGNAIDFNDKFCLNGTTGSTCIGDEGAPFAVFLGFRQVLAGIGSVPLLQCTVGYPSIFTNLLPHLDWINENTSNSTIVNTVKKYGQNFE